MGDSPLDPCRRCGISADEGGWCGLCGADLVLGASHTRFSRAAKERDAMWERDPEAAIAAYEERHDIVVGSTVSAPIGPDPDEPAGRPVTASEHDPLGALQGVIRTVSEAGSASDLDEHVADLWEAAHAARDAGFVSEVDAALLAASRESSGRKNSIFSSAYLQDNDREFRGLAVDGLDVRRVELSGGFTPLEDLEIACKATRDGSLIPIVRRTGENVFITIACEAQLFVTNDLPDNKARALNDRGLDFARLEAGPLNMLYGLRKIRRAVWGSGFLVLTDQRAIGLIIDDDVKGVPRSAERQAMPFALVEADGSGSALVFTVRRDGFENFDAFSQGFFASRLPVVQMVGRCSLAIDTVRALDATDSLVRPQKGAVLDAVRRFIP
jgi:hypothetical protein